MKLSKLLALGVVLPLALGGCMSDKEFKAKLEKTLLENPEVLTKVIEEKPALVMGALQKAAQKAQADMAKQREDDEKKQLEETYNKPLQPEIKDDAPMLGNKAAPITLVIYSDFQCPYCTRGVATAKALIKEYGNNIRYIYKHLPLSFHDQAMPASLYFEAIRLQSVEKAFAFHDYVYENQRQLGEGKEKFLQAAAKKAGADMKKLAADLKGKNEELTKRIKEDEAEAQKFEMSGTPGFILNGIPVRGAYPADYFKGIVEELKKRGKLKL